MLAKTFLTGVTTMHIESSHDLLSLLITLKTEQLYERKYVLLQNSPNSSPLRKVIGKMNTTSFLVHYHNLGPHTEHAVARKNRHKTEQK